MEYLEAGKIQKQEARHAAEVSKQTGFPSPATHYLEPSIDLNRELIKHPDATFYVRVSGNAWAQFSIVDKDVLLIDRARTPSVGDMALVVEEGAFKVLRIPRQRATDSFIVWGTITYIIHRTQ